MKGRATSPRQAIASKCRDCTYDTEAAGNWRQQTATCPVVHCALWAFRPLHGNAPAWLAARDAARLPDNWRSMPNVEAVAFIAGRAPNACEGAPFRDNAVRSDGNTLSASDLAIMAVYRRYSNGGAE